MVHRAESAERTWKLAGTAMVYTGVSAACFVVIPLLVLPLDAVRSTLHALWMTPALMKSSLPYLLSLMVLSGLVGSGLTALGRVYQNKRHDRALKVIKARRGTVITETLITLPPFFLLVFGLSQQSINTIAQILANVAVHRAAHSVWVWEPEQAHSTGRAAGLNVSDRACIAVAGVMTPVAPGDFVSVPSNPSSEMKRQRAALAMSYFPPGLSAVGKLIADASDLVPASVYSGNSPLGAGSSLSRGLDESAFMVRGAYKFTAAYRACGVTFADTSVSSVGSGGLSVPGYNVTMTYHHHQAMPVVGRVFSGWWTDIPFVGTVDFVGPNISDMTAVWQKTGRPLTHFITISRQLHWPKQAIKPNNRMPNNGGPGGATGGGNPSRDAVKGAL